MLANRPVGSNAPAFKLVGTDGKEYSLEQFAGKSAVALCWYLRAGSGRSRVELSGIQAEMEKLAKHQVQVLGITVSEAEENATFAKDLALTFPLLSDPQLTVANAYDGRAHRARRRALGDPDRRSGHRAQHRER